MSNFDSIVPGKVVNHGIVSGETFPEIKIVQTSPAHFPDFAAVTPKGKLSRINVPLNTFNRRYGETDDHYSPFYNPVTYGIKKLKEAGQYSIGFKRLTNNVCRARVVWGVTLFEGQKVPDYERNSDGSYKTSSNAAKIPKATKVDGIFALTGYLNIDPKYFNDTSEDSPTLKHHIAPIEVTVSKANSDLPAGTKGKFYPFVSLNSGVGDHYNNMYTAVGHLSTVDWDVVEQFVRTNGVYPFQMVIGERKSSGLNIDSYTQSGSGVGNFTLYDVKDKNTNVEYGLRRGLGEYTGANVNRPLELSDTPFDSLEVYQQNIDAVCAKLYSAEYGSGKSELPQINQVKVPRHAIMNPIDLKNESGVPYKYIVYPDGVAGTISVQYASLVSKPFTLTSRMQATGALDPFLKIDGSYSAAPSTWDKAKHGEWVAKPSSTTNPSKYQFWEMSQDLIEKYYTDYLGSKRFKDVIRDRTSFLWDLGYKNSISNLFIATTEVRKDFIAVVCGTNYGGNNSTEVIYTRAKTLNAKAVQIPESETYNAPATRISINLWEAYFIDEPSFDKFSLNIDTMCAFAAAGGSQDGRIAKGKLPDGEKGAVLRYAHTPSIGYEDDAPAAENLINGCITVRPYNMTQWKRPALPTVYNVTDSVLKDLVNVWFGVVIEKILQDQWIVVCGQTMPASSYLSTVKDNADKEIHNVMGSCLSSWDVQTEFRETNPNSRSRMYTKVVYWVGKARYMMDAVLEARNEEELESDTNG